MPVTITLPDAYTASQAQLLSELLERDLSDDPLMRKLLNQLRDAKSAVGNLQEQANRDRLMAADLLRQRDEARADAKGNDEEYRVASRERDELRAQLAAARAMAEEREDESKQADMNERKALEQKLAFLSEDLTTANQLLKHRLTRIEELALDRERWIETAAMHLNDAREAANELDELKHPDRDLPF